MTERLPTTLQFLTARGHLTHAGERALLAHYATNETTAKLFKIDCIIELKRAAKALGYELVEVVSTTAIDADGSHIEAAVPITPEADASVNDMAERT